MRVTAAVAPRMASGDPVASMAIPIGVPRGGGWLLNDRQSHKAVRPSTPACLTDSCQSAVALRLASTCTHYTLQPGTQKFLNPSF